MTENPDRWSRSRLLKAIALAVIGIAALVLLIRLSSVFIPVGIALLLAYILEPAIAFLGRHHTRRLFTVLIFYAFFLAVVVGGAILIVPPLVEQGKAFVNFAQQQGAKYNITWDMLSGAADGTGESESASQSWWPRLFSETNETEGATNGVPETVSTENQSAEIQDEPMGEYRAIGQFVSRHAAMLKEKIPAVALLGVKTIVTGAGNVAGFFTNLVLSLFYAFFFMLHLPAIGNAFARWVPRSRQEEVDDVLREIDEVVAGFFRGRLLVCLIAAAVTSAGLLISGIDFWLLLGIAAGFLGIIPFIGVALTLIPAVLIALTAEQSLFAVVGVLVTFGVVQGIVEPFVGPFLISRKVRLHPVTVIVAFMAGGVLFGVLGVLLAIPFCGVLKVLAQRYLVPIARSVLRPRGQRDNYT